MRVGPNDGAGRVLGWPQLTPEVRQKLIDGVHAEVGSRSFDELQQSGRSLALAARNFPLIALGYDENHKPRAARFPAAACRAGRQGRPAHGPQGL